MVFSRKFAGIFRIAILWNNFKQSHRYLFIKALLSNKLEKTLCYFGMLAYPNYFLRIMTSSDAMLNRLITSLLDHKLKFNVTIRIRY